MADPPLGSAPSCSGPALCWPRPSSEPPGARTLVLILDGEAEDVARAEASAVVHTAVEKRVRVRIRDVQDLASGCHVARDALVSRDADLIALQDKDGVGRKKLVGGQGGPMTVTLLPGPLQTPGPQDHGHTFLPWGPASPHHPPRPHQTPWPPAHSDPAGTQSSCGRQPWSTGP